MTTKLLKLSNESKKTILAVYNSKKDFKTGIEHAKIVVEKTVGHKPINIATDIYDILEAALKAASLEPEWLDLLLVASDELTNGLSNKSKTKQKQGSKPCKTSKNKKIKTRKDD